MTHQEIWKRLTESPDVIVQRETSITGTNQVAHITITHRVRGTLLATIMLLKDKPTATIVIVGIGNSEVNSYFIHETVCARHDKEERNRELNAKEIIESILKQ